MCIVVVVLFLIQCEVMLGLTFGEKRVHADYSPRCRGTCAWWTLWQVFDFLKENMIFKNMLKDDVYYILVVFYVRFFFQRYRIKNKYNITALQPI